MLSLAFRYRRARTAERAQLKWLVYAAALIVAVLLAEVPAGQAMGSGNAANNLRNAMTGGAIALIPVAIGIAVLRYRLYDIDRVISRTVAYAIITGVLVGIYAGLVLLATLVFGRRTPVPVAAATLAAARCSARCGGGCSAGGGRSTGRVMTPTRLWRCSRPG